MMRKSQRGFTLIELITVMAITAVLMTLIVLPVFQSFNITRAGQAFADAQWKARQISEQIVREIGNAASVRRIDGLVPAFLNQADLSDNSKFSKTTAPAHSIIIQIPRIVGGPSVDYVLPYSKLDYFKPAENGDLAADGVTYINPVSGLADPTLTAPKGQYRLPIAPGTTLVRWFIGLRDPFKPYNNPYDGLLMSKAGGRDNLFVLYRAEVPATTDFFRNNGGVAEIDDPKFFIDDATAPDGTPDSKKHDRIVNWLKKSVIKTEVSRYDMIMPIYDKASRKVQVAANGLPNILPLIQFRPTTMTKDVVEGKLAVRPGEETNGAALVAPDVYKGRNGLWVNAVVRNYQPGFNPGTDVFQMGSQRGTDFVIDAQVPGGIPWTLFDLGVYEGTVASGTGYPFTQAATDPQAIVQVDAAEQHPFWVNDSGMRQMFTPYVVNNKSGKILTSFNISEVGNPAINLGHINLPITQTGQALSPLNSTGAGAVYGGAGYEINSAFNRAWNENPNLQPDIQRFIYLAVTPNEDGTLPPLCPVHFSDTVTGFVDPNTGLNRCHITPGTEVVYGPDQTPGPNYGNKVRYTRTTRNPGPNEYRINYVDQKEPNYALLGLPNPPAQYTPTDFVSAVIQPRYKAGYIQLNSDPNAPLPSTTPVTVSYRFQFTGSNGTSSDTFTVDYDTQQVLQVLLTVRNYAQADLPNPQTVTLKSTATLRNFNR